MIWKNKELRDISDLIDAIENCVDKDEAQAFVFAYEAINENARDNIGWVIGEVDRDVGQRIIDWFECEHPVFGTKFPTPEEAFKAGMELGEMVREHGAEYAIQKMRKPNKWFLGALE